MAIQAGKMECDIYKSAFSGEIVFSVKTTSEDIYEGVAPSHYADFKGELFPETPYKGALRVRIISNGGDTAQVATPDGEVLVVPATAIKH